MEVSRHPMVAYVIDFCGNELTKQGVLFEPTEIYISVAKVTELVNYANRDLERISKDLAEEVSRQKYAAYYGFWFAKIAPISNVRRNDHYKNEIVDINERLAIRLSLDLILNSIGVPTVPEDIQALSEEDAAKVGSTKAPTPLVWELCEKKCSGACFKTGSVNFLTFHDNQNFEYIVHSLRHRGVGPYFLVAILEAMVANSCEGTELFQKKAS